MDAKIRLLVLKPTLFYPFSFFVSFESSFQCIQQALVPTLMSLFLKSNHLYLVARTASTPVIMLLLLLLVQLQLRQDFLFPVLDSVI